MRKILILLCLVTLLTIGCQKNDAGNNEAKQQQEEQTKVENKKEMAPDFKLESLDGTEVKLSDFRGKNVIINFWATWCGYCIEEMPDLQKLQNKYKDEDLVVLAVNVGDSKEVVQKFTDDNKLNLIVLLDKDSSISNIYGLRSFPSTVTVNKKGEIVTGYIGLMSYEKMEKMYSFFNKE